MSEPWIGSKDGVSIKAYSSRSQIDRALNRREIDSGYPVDQFEGDQKIRNLALWVALGGTLPDPH